MSIARGARRQVVQRRALIAAGKSRCSKCRRALLVSAFYRRVARNGYSSWCRACAAAHQHEKRYSGRNIDNATRLRLGASGRKWCAACRRDKPKTEFYKESSRPDGFSAYCSECCSRHRREKYAANLESSRAYSRARYHLYGYDRSGANAASKIAHAAHEAVHRALRRGALVRPASCSSCISRRGPIEGHHDDYSKRLDVIWLCSTCHKRMHAAHSRGARNGELPSAFLPKEEIVQ